MAGTNHLFGESSIHLQQHGKHIYLVNSNMQSLHPKPHTSADQALFLEIDVVNLSSPLS